MLKLTVMFCSEAAVAGASSVRVALRAGWCPIPGSCAVFCAFLWHGQEHHLACKQHKFCFINKNHKHRVVRDFFFSGKTLSSFPIWIIFYNCWKWRELQVRIFHPILLWMGQKRKTKCRHVLPLSPFVVRNIERNHKRFFSKMLWRMQQVKM